MHVCFYVSLFNYVKLFIKKKKNIKLFFGFFNKLIIEGMRISTPKWSKKC